MKLVFGLLIMPLIFVWSLPIVAQESEKEMLRQLIAEERETVDALVLYPAETRIAILEVCLYPEALVKVSRVQQKTHEAFKALVENYPREVQEVVWDLSRYPKLIARIVEGGSKSRIELEAFAQEYPSEIRAMIVNAGMDHYTLLSKIQMLERDAASAFHEVIKHYPQSTRESFNALIELPEVLSLLTEDIELAILAGEVYRNDPQWVLHKADSLNLIAAQENARELEDWKRSLEQNPEVESELKASAEEFAEEYQYDDAYYEGDDIYYDRSPDRVGIRDQYYHHYPYWFGYPHWYDYPRWRPYPYWWDWGFYYSNHTIVIINLPSYYFTHWYFFRPHHHYHYPHLSAHFVRHQYYHPRPASSITVSVKQWQRSNRNLITDDWLKAGDRQDVRVARFREFGKFEIDREKYNQARPQKPLTQREYLEKYPDRYSQIKRPAVQPGNIDNTPDRIQRPSDPPDRVESEKRQKDLPRRTDDAEKVPVRPKRQSVPAPRPVEPKKESPAKKPMPEIDKASTHHKNSWEGNKRTSQQAATPAKNAPARRTSPRRN